ncbi:MAG: hypothetical protein K2Y32_14475 [Candidatus Obscuribacterales bacterium]|nr:hypothetical protein [Candidatus Obscuribacterales bacterium]
MLQKKRSVELNSVNRSNYCLPILPGLARSAGLARFLTFSALLPSLSLVSIAVNPAYCGTNDFFGNSIPTVGDPSGSTRPAASSSSSPSEISSSPSASEFTDDEKRMQKKYKLAIKHAQTLIAKADKMIKDGEARKDNKLLKKGQVLKGVGERALENLKTNNPLPGQSLQASPEEAKQ